MTSISDGGLVSTCIVLLADISGMSTVTMSQLDHHTYICLLWTHAPNQLAMTVTIVSDLFHFLKLPYPLLCMIVSQVPE